MKKHLFLAMMSFTFTPFYSMAQSPILWGLTLTGGQTNSGVIFSYNTETDTETVQYSFNGVSGSAPISPYGNLIKASNGLLYALPSAGGQDELGSLVSFNIANAHFTDILDFGSNASSGAHPFGSLMQASDSLFYGMTQVGGANTGPFGLGDGILFSYDLANHHCADLHDFGSSDTDGTYPLGSLIQAYNGLLYGMAQNGGTVNETAPNIGDGSIFSYNISTRSYVQVYDFDSLSGQKPLGTLLQGTDSLLYGMTEAGGVTDSGVVLNGGVIFSYNISNDSFSVLHLFGSDTDGYAPWGSLIQVGDSLLYGMTKSGGAHHGGIIFSYNIFTHVYADLHDFGSGADGVTPFGSLFQASDGLLYGMTSAGGTNGARVDSAGTLFSYDIATGVETVLHSFVNGLDGSEPYGSLIEVNELPTGIVQVSSNENGLRIFPNPTSGEFMVKLPDNVNSFTAEVYNVVGDKIYQAVLNGSQNVFNLNDQPAGVYYVYFKSATGMQAGTVLITK